jgi:hypothetical protein
LRVLWSFVESNEFDHRSSEIECTVQYVRVVEQYRA